MIDAFAAAEVAVAPVYDVAQYASDPQVLAREAITAVDDPDLGPVRMQNVLFGLSSSPGAIRHTGRDLGADTDEVLKGVGLSVERINELRAKRVVA